MDSNGEILRRARNKRRWTLDDVAARTRINRKYLEAIESGDRSAIPGGFFYKSFVRQYAAALSTHDSDVLEEIEESLAAQQPALLAHKDEEVLKALASTVTAQERESSAARRSTAAYAILLVLVVTGSTGLYVLWHRAQQPPAVEKRSIPGLSAKAEEPRAEPQPAERSQPQPQQPTPAPVEQPQQTAPAPAADPEDKIAINVSANDTTWFSLSTDGKTVFSGSLAAGQTKTFGAKENARMKVGNAGGLAVVFNGTPTGPLGPQGQVVTVMFTPENFEITRPKPPDEQPQD